jgi:hypothetical protein
MTKIAILCGESPLPVCQALKTLAADEVVIIHGQGGSKNVADRVKDFCKDTLNIDKSKVHLLEVDAFHPIRCHNTLFENKTLLASSALVYGPGTSVMNAMIHDVWRSAGGNDSKVGQSWYLQATPSRLLPSNDTLATDPISTNATGMNTPKLLALHIPDDHKINSLDAKSNLKKPKIDIYTFDLEVAPHVEDCLYKGYEMPKEVKAFVKPDYSDSETPGFFLEGLLFTVFSRSLGVDEINHSVKTSLNGHSVLEMDLLLREKDSCIWISCHTTKKNDSLTEKNVVRRNDPTTDFRKKYFEAKENALRLGGKESRSITVVNRSIESLNPWVTNPPDIKPYDFPQRLINGVSLRQKLDLPDKPTVSNKHIIVDLAEILGDNPNKAVTETWNTGWVYEWVKESFGLPN